MNHAKLTWCINIQCCNRNVVYTEDTRTIWVPIKLFQFSLQVLCTYSNRTDCSSTGNDLLYPCIPTMFPGTSFMYITYAYELRTVKINLRATYIITVNYLTPVKNLVHKYKYHKTTICVNERLQVIIYITI